jgi:CheY-like chemotaxis protein
MRTMETKHTILMVDDDPDMLDMYREILKRLPSQPEVQTAASGARALAMLESEPYRLLITDLKMPRMDGLQLLSIVRKKHPNLRTVVLTSVVDEQFRSRVYALGVDLFWQKPASEREVEMFKDCMQSLIELEDRPGFRGVQSKSLVDIIQLECLSQSSSVLRITNGPLVGRIWINHGELFDAGAGNLQGEEAFHHILTWRAGSFELLPAEPHHAHVIKKSCNALLLETAQAFDEANNPGHDKAAVPGKNDASDPLSQLEGLEFFAATSPGAKKADASRGIENPETISKWAHDTMGRFDSLGDRLHTGQPETIVGLGLSGHVGITRQGRTEFCGGWNHSMTAAEVRESTKKASALWGS